MYMYVKYEVALTLALQHSGTYMYMNFLYDNSFIPEQQWSSVHVHAQ